MVPSAATAPMPVIPNSEHSTINANNKNPLPVCLLKLICMFFLIKKGIEFIPFALVSSNIVMIICLCMNLKEKNNESK